MKSIKKLSEQAWAEKKFQEKWERRHIAQQSKKDAANQAKQDAAYHEKIRDLIAELEAYFVSMHKPDEEIDKDLLYNACIRICANRAIASNRSVKWFVMHSKLAYLDCK